MFDCQIDPLLGQSFESFESLDLIAQLRHKFGSNILGPAFHLVGVADLVISALLLFSVLILPRE